MFIKTASLSAAVAIALFVGGSVYAQDAMAPMMSDDDLTRCVGQAKAITFPDVAMVAEQACHSVHNGQGAMGGDAMGADAMMGGNGMAPKK